MEHIGWSFKRMFEVRVSIVRQDEKSVWLCEKKERVLRECLKLERQL